MKYFVIALLSVTFFNDPIKIGKINKAKAEARAAYISGNYKKAIATYKYLVDSLGVDEDEVKLNLANAYYLDKDTANASSLYQSLSSSIKTDISSKALQQLGVMANQTGKSEVAVNHFKQAVKADPTNEQARHNYEMLKRKLDQQKDQQENKDDKKKNDQKNENKKQEPSDFAKKLKERSDVLVAQRQYQAAYELMVDGLKQDKTVATYDDYIKRIKEVTEISK